jgi:excisionase family DNA binding protein
MDTMPRIHEPNRQWKLAHPSRFYPDEFGGIWSMLLEENLSIEGKIPTRLMNAQDIAEALSIGLSTVYLLMDRGELPSIRIGRSVRVRPEDLEEFIESRVQRKAAF